MDFIQKLLLIDDEPGFLRILKKVLMAANFDVVCAENARDALKILDKDAIDVVVSDIRLPGMDGLALLEKVKSTKPEIEIILMTGHETVDTAIEAMKKGAFDFLTKPFPTEKLLLLLDRINEHCRVNAENSLLKSKNCGESQINEGSLLLVSSQAMMDLYEKIKKIAITDSPILILGESGTGKELIAKEIHRLSLRSDRQIVTTNCSNLSPDLFESEVFGHVQGAFTGASNEKKGLVQIASGGTFFLDEVADLSPEGQAKILRLLQEHEYKRLGENFTRKSNVRIIAATNKNLETGTKQGQFRLDLFYRLNAITIKIPPLKERKEDIAELANFFIKNCAKKYNKSFEPLSDLVVQLLERHPWPGNIRELENACQHSAILGRPPSISLRDLPESILQQAKTNKEDQKSDTLNTSNKILQLIETPHKTLGEKVEIIEKILVAKALEIEEWNFSKAAARLGLSRQSFRYKLKKYDFKKD